MKTVCFFSGDITRGGGTERVAVRIANALVAEGTYRVLFLSLVEQSPAPFYEIDGRIARHTLGDKWILPGPGYLKLLPGLKRFLRKERVAVVIDIDIVLDALSIPMARATGTKVISWGHFSYYFEQRSLYRKLILRYSAKRADYCVTINEENCDCYRRFLHRETGLRVIYNPVERPESLAAAKEKWILWVGRLVEVKGVDDLAGTASLVLPAHPDWSWIVVGDGEQRELLERTIEEQQLQGRLVLAGKVDEVAEYYERAQIFVLTSRSEGLPMCLLEAKSHRLPSVSFDIGSGTSELIRDGVNGYLVEPRNCGEMARRIGELIEDEPLRRQFAEQTVLDAEKFEPESVMRSWNEVIESLCS